MVEHPVHHQKRSPGGQRFVWEASAGRQAAVQPEGQEQRLPDSVDVGKAAPGVLHDRVVSTAERQSQRRRVWRPAAGVDACPTVASAPTSLQRVFHFLCERGGGERLLEKAGNPLTGEQPHGLRFAVAAGDDDLRVWAGTSGVPAGPRLHPCQACSGPAGPARYLRGVASPRQSPRARRPPTAPGSRAVREYSSRCRAQLLRRPPRGWFRCRTDPFSPAAKRRNRTRMLRHRQQDREARALAGRARDRHRALVPADNTADGGKPQPAPYELG